jgi:anti-anti-sigma factor
MTRVPLTVTSHVEDGFAILELSGSLTLAPSLTTLRDNARQVLGIGNLSGIILRVSQVMQADSAGLGELTVIYTMATKRGCPIRLVEASPSLRKMLELTHLDGLLPTTSDVTAAKAEMKQG